MMIRKWFKVKTGDITVIQFIIEGYEGIATVSTIDPRAAILQILIMPDFDDDAEKLLEYMKTIFFMEEITPSESQVSLC